MEGDASPEKSKVVSKLDVTKLDDNPRASVSESIVSKKMEAETTPGREGIADSKGGAKPSPSSSSHVDLKDGTKPSPSSSRLNVTGANKSSPRASETRLAKLQEVENDAIKSSPRASQTKPSKIRQPEEALASRHSITKSSSNITNGISVQMEDSKPLNTAASGILPTDSEQIPAASPMVVEVKVQASAASLVKEKPIGNTPSNAGAKRTSVVANQQSAPQSNASQKLSKPPEVVVNGSSAPKEGDGAKDEKRERALPAGITSGSGIIASIDHGGATDYETDVESKKGKKPSKASKKKDRKPMATIEDDSFQVAMVKLLAAEKDDGVDPFRESSNKSRSMQRHKPELEVEDDDGYNTAVPTRSFTSVKARSRSNGGSGYESQEDNRQKAKRRHREDDLFRNKKKGSKRTETSQSKNGQSPEDARQILDDRNDYEKPTPRPIIMRKDEAPAKAVSKPKKELTRTTAEEEAPAKLATKPATKPKRESTWTAEDENYSKLEAENAFLKQHLVGLQTNSKEVWGKEAEFTERIRILEESVEDERKEREQLDTENRELKGKIAALKRQVLKEANRAALVPKIVANRVPASVEANINLRHQFHLKLITEREKYSRLEDENRELVARVRSLEATINRRAVNSDSKSPHRVNEVLLWKKKIREIDLEKSKVEERVAFLTRQLERGDVERDRLRKELDDTRALLSQQLSAGGADLLPEDSELRSGLGSKRKGFGSSNLRAKTTSKPSLRGGASVDRNMIGSVKGKRIRQSSMPPLSGARSVVTGNDDDEDTFDLKDDDDVEFTNAHQNLRNASPPKLRTTSSLAREARSLVGSQRRARSAERGKVLEVAEEDEEVEAAEQDVDLSLSRDLNTPSKMEYIERELSSGDLFSQNGSRNDLDKESKKTSSNKNSQRGKSTSKTSGKNSKSPSDKAVKERRKRTISEGLPTLPNGRHEKQLVMDSDNEERPTRFVYRDSSISMASVGGIQLQPPIHPIKAAGPSQRAQMDIVEEDDDQDDERMKAARTQLEYNIYVGSKKIAATEE